MGRWLGSAGGPTGELHRLDPNTGEIREKVKELIFLPGGEEELKTADKSRKALRYGAHSFDCSPNSGDGVQVAYVADLGANAIQAYSFPALEHLYTVPSARPHDGPRHVIPHPHHPVVFTVTEHTSYVDAYQVPPYGVQDLAKEEMEKSVRWVGSADMLTPTQATQREQYRGDTLRFSSDLRYIFATTRGKTSSTKGLVVAYKLTITQPSGESYSVELREVARFETRTSGGKANAIELAPNNVGNGHNGWNGGNDGEGVRDLMILTDDEQGYLDILSFNPQEEEFKVEATTQLPKLENGEWQGASHAIWLL